MRAGPSWPGDRLPPAARHPADEDQPDDPCDHCGREAVYDRTLPGGLFQAACDRTTCLVALDLVAGQRDDS